MSGGSCLVVGVVAEGFPLAGLPPAATTPELMNRPRERNQRRRADHVRWLTIISDGAWTWHR
jgi:hypothetical protein